MMMIIGLNQSRVDSLNLFGQFLRPFLFNCQLLLQLAHGDGGLALDNALFFDFLLDFGLQFVLLFKLNFCWIILLNIKPLVRSFQALYHCSHFDVIHVVSPCLNVQVKSKLTFTTYHHEPVPSSTHTRPGPSRPWHWPGQVGLWSIRARFEWLISPLLTRPMTVQWTRAFVSDFGSSFNFMLNY